MRKVLNSSLLAFAILLAAFGSPTAQAASVASGGYTADFTSQPLVADWATFSIGGGAGDITTAAAMDAAVQNLSAATITSAVAVDAANPPGINSLAVWSSAGAYLQTRPTGNGATVLMCQLVNNLGVEAVAASVAYDFAKVAPAAEEVAGQRAYYSLSGAARS